MAIQNLIAHRIIKSSPSTPCQLKIRSDEIKRDGKVEELCRELKNTYIRKGGKQYGSFSEDIGAYPLAGWLRDWLEQRLVFTTLATKIGQHLQQHFDQSQNPIDNILVIFYEQIEAGEALYIFLVDHQAGQYFDGELNIGDVLYLDTQSFNLAAKIKTAEFLTGNNLNYLSLLKWRGEKELSEAFGEAIGLSNKVDVAADTSEFLDLVTNYTTSMPEDIAKETRRNAVEYCLTQDKAGQPVQIKQLAEYISAPDHPDFAHFAQTTKAEIKDEWIPDKTQLKNYVRISGRDEQLSMSFASACLGNTIFYDADSDSITIKNIPTSLKTRLMQHLQKRPERK